MIAGSGKLTVAGIDYELQKGQHFILPNDVKEWQLEGTLTLIASVPGKKA